MADPFQSDRSRYRAIFDSATDFAIIGTDRDGLITDWNRGAERILGWSATEMRGAPIHRIFTPEDRENDRPGTEMRGALATGRADDERWHLCRRDGQEKRFWAAGEMMPLYDEARNHLGFLKILRDRSAQHAEREQQRADTEFLHSVLAASGDCIKVLDLQGRLLFMNEGGKRLMEVHDFSQIQGCPWPDFWRDAGNAQAIAAMHAAKQGGIGRFQGPATTMLGTAKLWDVQVTTIAGPDGQAEKLLVVSRDITAERQAEDALHESQALNSLILDASRDWIVVLGIDGAIQHINAGGIAEIETADPAAVIGESWLDAWPDQDHAKAEAALAEARSGGAGRFQGCRPTRAGQPKWWDVVISPLNGPDDRPERLVAVGRDVTRRKQAEAALTELNATLEQRVEARTRERDQIWHASQDMLCVANLNGYFVGLNPAWCNTLGWSDAELRAVPFIGFVHPDDRAATLVAAEGLRQGEAQLNFENRYRRRDGSYCWLSWNAVMRDGLIYAVVRDMTVFKQQAETQLQLEEQLRQAQKMEAVGQLTGGLAHDFNNLLTGITGSLELLRTRLAQGRGNDADRLIGAAQGAADRAAALTHRLLAFSRRQTLDPKPTDANGLIQGMEELVQRTVGPGIALVTELAGDLWPILCDPNQLENALLNLCINAHDAMPDGGRLTIETTNTVLRAGDARDTDLPAGDYVVIAVGDSGIGMSPETAARAFDPFFTTKPIGQGTGLGLSMIYGFTRQSGGQSRIQTALGQGTIFRIYLPRHAGLVPKMPERLPAANAGGAGLGETVLVVDDEPTVRMLVTDVLDDLGYRTLEAADAVEGLTMLQSSKRIDMLITDVGLPGGMNGRQLADAARLQRPGLKVLFITGYAETAVIRDGQLDPGMAVMTKPFALDALGNKIRAILAA